MELENVIKQKIKGVMTDMSAGDLVLFAQSMLDIAWENPEFQASIVNEIIIMPILKAPAQRKPRGRPKANVSAPKRQGRPKGSKNKAKKPINEPRGQMTDQQITQKLAAMLKDDIPEPQKPTDTQRMMSDE